MKPKTCKQCGKIFTPSNSLIPYCTYKCKDRHDVEKRKVAREKKKSSVPSLKKTADDLWSKAIRKVGYCTYCGSTEFLNAHHIFSRINMSTRWELSNGICLCSKHHTFSNEFSAHKTPTEFTYWLEKQRGREYIDNLSKLAKTIQKVDQEYLNQRIVFFRKYLEGDYN